MRVLLEQHGHAVELLEASSAATSKARAATSLLYGGLDSDEVGATARAFRADVVHAHNVHPFFGWRALAAARQAGARTVLHLHNFRLFCAIGVAYRDGAPCFRCHGRDTRPGLRYRCRGSLPEAAVYAIALRAQQSRLLRHADRIVTVSQSLAGQLFALGLPRARVSTLHNFVPVSDFVPRSHAGTGGFALASGRLVTEKGFDVAIAAAREARIPLVIAGAGPDEARLRRAADGADVRFTGRLSPADLADLRGEAGLVLVPSRSDEACPYAVLEGFASGVPVIGSDRGALPELLGADAVVPSRDVGGWSALMRRLWDDPAERQRRGVAALAAARASFSPTAYHEALMALYRG